MILQSQANSMNSAAIFIKIFKSFKPAIRAFLIWTPSFSWKLGTNPHINGANIILPTLLFLHF